MAAIDRIVALCHHRWAVPVLAQLHADAGARLVTLVQRLGASRGALRQTLDALVRSGWIRRNPGHGHPLRPEYVLTPAGRRIAPICARFMDAIRALGLEEVALRKWSVPVLCVLGGRQARFSDLRDRLPDATDRALTLALRKLQAARLIDRRVLGGRPPGVAYSPTRDARRLLPIITGLREAAAGS